MLKNNFLCADVLYRSAVDEEKQWRREKVNKNDVILVEKLINEINKLGYKYVYLADITKRKNNDDELLNVILKYIGSFQDEYISAELVGVVGKKHNIRATEKILSSYRNSSEETKHKHAAFYDNALWNIKDKRYISVYLELLKTPEDAIRLPLTMEMLAMWNIEDAKPYFIQYLDSTLLYHNDKISDLFFCAIDSLSYYKDYDGKIRKALEKKLQHKDKDVVNAVKRTIKRLDTGDGSLCSKNQ